MLAMRGQFERDQLVLEQSGRCVPTYLCACGGANTGDRVKALERDEYCRRRPNGSQGRADKAAAGTGDSLAKQVRCARQTLLAAPDRAPRMHKQLTLKASSAQEAIDKMDCVEKGVKVKNLEFADMKRDAIGPGLIWAG